MISATIQFGPSFHHPNRHCLSSSKTALSPQTSSLKCGSIIEECISIGRLFERLHDELAGTQHEHHLLRLLRLLDLPGRRADLDAVHEEAAGVEAVEVVLGLALGRGLEDERAEVLADGHRSLRFLHGAEGHEPILIFYVLLSGLGVELLVLLGPVLRDSHVLVGLIEHGALLLVLFVIFAVVLGYIFVLDLDDVLFILVDDAEEFPLDARVVLVDVVLAEEVHLLLLDEV